MIKNIIAITITNVASLLLAGIVYGESVTLNLSKNCKEGNVEVAFVNYPQMEQGFSGKGVKVFGKNPENMVKITLVNGLPSLDGGGISFWISPDWNGRDGKYHILCTLHFHQKEKSERRILIYKYANPTINSKGLGLLAKYDDAIDKKQGIILNMPQRKIGEDWSKSNWHFLALYWNKSGTKPLLELFVDGERVAYSHKDFDLSGECVITLGPVWGEPDATIFDRFKIYDHVLSPKELDKELEITFEKIEKMKVKK